VLRDALDPLAYDQVVIDTPSNLGLLTVNALAADLVVAPVAAGDEGAAQGPDSRWRLLLGGCDSGGRPGLVAGSVASVPMQRWASAIRSALLRLVPAAVLSSGATAAAHAGNASVSAARTRTLMLPFRSTTLIGLKSASRGFCSE
jgi:hypothetical protein